MRLGWLLPRIDPDLLIELSERKQVFRKQVGNKSKSETMQRSRAATQSRRLAVEEDHVENGKRGLYIHTGVGKEVKDFTSFYFGSLDNI